MNRSNNAKGSALLCLAALLWGLAFVVQSDVADTVPPFLLTAVRCAISAIFLLGFLFLKKGRQGRSILPKGRGERRMLLRVSVLCGIFLSVCINLQQFGLRFYPEGVAAEARGGFLTSLYVLLVPLFAWFFGKRLTLSVILSVAVAAVGVYLLCLADGWRGLYLSDVLIFLCAVAFAAHILTVSLFGHGIDALALSMLQFAVCACISAVLSLCFDPFDLKILLPVIPSLLFLGIGSGSIAYTLQIVGQKYAEPTVAALSMSLESVFAALGGWIYLQHTLSIKEILGCTLMFLAILLAQLPQPSKVTKTKDLP